MTTLPTPGDAAPDFTAINQSGETVSLADFVGSWLVLYFYPKDNTPGCTTEAIAFSDYQSEFAALGAKILGISPDSVTSHAKFIEKKSLSISLLSDPDHTVAEAYGVWGLKKFMGKEYMGILRSTVLIDPQGRVAQVWPKVKVKDHAQTVLSQLKTLVDR